MYINSGYQNYLAVDKILAISRCDSAPMRRMIMAAEDNDMLIDHTMGRARRSVIILTTGHMVISAVETETLLQRVRTQSRGES